MPNTKEDKILYSFLVLSIISFLMIRIFSLFLFFQAQNKTCSTVICPDMKNKMFHELPLTIKMLEIIKPIGVILSLIAFEMIFLLLNVLNKNNKLIAFIGVGVASTKILATVIEMGSNLDTIKYVTDKTSNTFIYLNVIFVCAESLLLYGSILAAFFRYKLQMNDHLVQ